MSHFLHVGRRFEHEIGNNTSFAIAIGHSVSQSGRKKGLTITRLPLELPFWRREQVVVLLAPCAGVTATGRRGGVCPAQPCMRLSNGPAHRMVALANANTPTSHFTLLLPIAAPTEDSQV